MEIRLTINSFFINFNDIDGTTSIGEQNWADNPTSYTISNPTELTMSNVGSWVLGTSGTNTYTGAENTNDIVNYAVNYNNRTEIRVRVGGVSRTSSVSTTRLHVLEFSCLTNYTNPETYGIDIDSDGVANYLDLDSDNDGIYDAEEANHGQSYTNGILTGVFGTNGLANSVETSIDSGVINYTILNTDGTDAPNYLDLDSDGDGCADVLEAGFTDDNNDGNLGDDPLVVNSNGVVTSGSDGYINPVDNDSNLTLDYLEVGTVPSITVQPINVTTCPGCNTSLSVVSNGDAYQWQRFNGGFWINLTDSGIYSGSVTNVLVITNPTTSENNSQYRVISTNSNFVCGNIISNQVMMTIQVNSVISNRRITHRVNRN